MAHHLSADKLNRKKRYYDMWDSKGDTSDNVYRGSMKSYSLQGRKKEDPCANKPLWYLKYQARLGRLSPFYDCLNVYRI